MAGTDDSREKQAARSRRWYLANRQKAATQHKAWKEANRESWYASGRAWIAENPERKAYINHRSHAKRRGIEFLLTFEEWWAIWEDSGKWEQRGFRKDQYVMARFADQGAYAVGNVRICTATENAAERGPNLSSASRKRMSDGLKRAWLRGVFDQRHR